MTLFPALWANGMVNPQKKKVFNLGTSKDRLNFKYGNSRVAGQYKCESILQYCNISASQYKCNMNFLRKMNQSLHRNLFWFWFLQCYSNCNCNCNMLQPIGFPAQIVSTVVTLLWQKRTMRWDDKQTKTNLIMRSIARKG